MTQTMTLTLTAPLTCPRVYRGWNRYIPEVLPAGTVVEVALIAESSVPKAEVTLADGRQLWAYTADLMAAIG